MTNKSTKINKTHKVITEDGSALSKYQSIMVGSKSFRFLLYFELCTWLGKIPGAAGILLRKIFWPRLFGTCGKGVMFADNIVLRHRKRIHQISSSSIISEGCVLDARHDTENKALSLDDDVMLSINVMISCKNGCLKFPRN